MSLLLVSIALMVPALGQDTGRATQGKDGTMPMVKLDGNWTVTYAEMDGKKIDTKSYTQVTIRGNTVTCKCDGKEHSWRLEFGPHNLIRCAEQIDGKTTTTDSKLEPGSKGHHTHHGVYIASQEFFCLSMNKGHDHRNFTSGAEQGGRQGEEQRQAQPQPGAGPRFGSNHQPHGAHFVLILQRSGTSAPTRP